MKTLKTRNQKVRRRKMELSQSGFTVVSVIFVMLVLGSMGAGMSSALSTQASRSFEMSNAQKAIYVADGGLDFILANQLANSSDFTTASTVNNKSLGNGTFSVSYANPTATSTTVTVTAQVGNSSRTVQQTVTKTPKISGTLHSGGNVVLDQSQSGGGTITGNIVYGGNLTMDAGYTVTGTSQQGSGPGAVAGEVTAVKNLVTNTYNGNLAITGTYTNNIRATGNITINGSADITGIIFADGNITIDCDHSETINLNGTLGASGNIVFDGKHSCVSTMTAQSVNSKMQPLMVASGNIDMEFHQDTVSTFKGLIRAGGNAIFTLRQQDIVNILGAVSANGNIVTDSKQTTVINVNSPGGTAYLDNYLKLQNWKET